MRWPNGGPPRLYALVINENAQILAFPSKRARTEWLVKKHETYTDGMYTLLTYVQKEKS